MRPLPTQVAQEGLIQKNEGLIQKNERQTGAIRDLKEKQKHYKGRIAVLTTRVAEEKKKVIVQKQQRLEVEDREFNAKPPPEALQYMSALITRFPPAGGKQ